MQLRYLDISGVTIDKRSAEALGAGLGSPKCFLSVLRIMDCNLKPGHFDIFSAFDAIGSSSSSFFFKKNKRIKKNHLIQ